MSKKTLDVGAITNELAGSSLFFTQPLNPPPKLQTELDSATISRETKTDSTTPVSTEVVNPTPENIIIEANKPPRNNASTPASKQASKPISENDHIESIRKTIKQVGKEVVFVRVSPEEKHTLGSIVYSFNEIYRGEGRKTSENEIGRIALNFALEDYRENGNNSIIAKVLAALNA